MHFPKLVPPYLSLVEPGEGGEGGGGGGGKPPEQQQSGQEGGGKPEGGKRPPWGKPENFDAEKAWELIQTLKADRASAGEKNLSLQKRLERLDQMEKTQQAQQDALAKAFGLKPEETSDTDKLTQQLSALTEKFTAAERKAALLEVAANPGTDAEGKTLPAIPKEYHHLLTATDAEGLAAQAKSVAALVAAQSGQNGTPAFQQSQGQGQGGGQSPSLKDQIGEAERDLASKQIGSPEYRAAQAKVTQLKSQQLAALKSR